MSQSLLPLDLLHVVLKVLHILELVELLTHLILLKLRDIIHHLLFNPSSLLVLNRERLTVSSLLFADPSNGIESIRLLRPLTVHSLSVLHASIILISFVLDIVA